MGSVSANCARLSIRRDRGRVADGGPARRVFEFEREPGFQVRLVEAWKGHAGVHGYKQGVEVFIAIVLVFIPGDGFTCGSGIADECEGKRVVAGDGGEIEMAILEFLRDRMAVERSGLNHTIAVVDRKIAGCLAFEGKRLGAGYR